jgi:hypothetical protein
MKLALPGFINVRGASLRQRHTLTIRFLIDEHQPDNPAGASAMLPRRKGRRGIAQAAWAASGVRSFAPAPKPNPIAPRLFRAATF